MRVLLVEDDATLCDAVQAGLVRAGMAVDALGAAEPADTALRCTAYDLMILDVGLPGASGLSQLRSMRRRGEALPVLMLTARDTLEDRVQGLNEGADDYVVKPFLMPELVARCQALVRRSRAAASAVLELGPLRLDVGRCDARLAGAPLELTRREWDLLHQLLLAAPNVVTKHKLIDSFGAWDREVSANAIEICASRLRAKLGGEAGIVLRTVRGIGYRIEAAVRQGEGDEA